jgi:hypothetical protein
VRALSVIIAALAALGLLVFWSLGETVILRTTDAAGAKHETRLWIVDHAGSSWLRSAQDHGWFQRLQANPQVELRRDGRWTSFRAVTSEARSDRLLLNRLFAEKYGFADALISHVFDHSMPVAVRLEPQ